jgi:hypothetical protein
MIHLLYSTCLDKSCDQLLSPSMNQTHRSTLNGLSSLAKPARLMRQALEGAPVSELFGSGTSL